jgi:8-oxo-dGTP pyrophosphatase MutT (NUDIX family)
MADDAIQAAGGVLWRPAVEGPGIEVGIVHRPKYDDWSVPKGKLMPGEHVLLAALREVREETGYSAVVGRRLPSIGYLKDGEPKEAHYWVLRQKAGRFVPNDEVDRMMWLPPREAQVHLLPTRDRPILQAFEADTRPTRAVVVVRHASAGDRDAWSGDDHDRPLDELGREQAALLADLLDAYDVQRALSADVLRCIETLGPATTRRLLTVESEPLLSESGFAANPDAAEERLLDIVLDPRPTVVSTQKTLLPGVVLAVARRLGAPPYDGPSTVRKGAAMVLHVTTDSNPQVVAVEYLPTIG